MGNMRSLGLIGWAAVVLSTGIPAGSATGLQRQLTEIERTRGHAMLDGLRAVLERRYYDSTFGGRDLERLWWRSYAIIDTATTWPAVLAALAAFPQSLEDSHTRFIPPGLSVEPDYGWSWRMVGEDCYVFDVERGSDAERNGLRVGDKVLSIDGLRPDRRGAYVIWYVYHILSPRQGMRLYVQHADGTRESVAFEARLRRVQTDINLTRLIDLQRLIDESDLSARAEHRWRTFDSVAVWGFSHFQFRDIRIETQMREAQRYPWLIIDLRGNPGGAVVTLTRLLGFFFEEGFVALEERWRDSTVAHRVEPVTPTYRGQVLVLIDSRSASASEIFSRVMQQRGRAMVIGDRSRGAVMASNSIGLSHRASDNTITYGLSVTVYDVVMPDSTRLEGNGVVPNVPALPTPQDLAEGRDPALQFALELAGVRLSAAEVARQWR